MTFSLLSLVHSQRTQEIRKSFVLNPRLARPSASLDASFRRGSSRRSFLRALFHHLPRPLATFAVRDHDSRRPPSSFFFASWRLVRPQGYYRDLRPDPDAPTFPACSRGRQHTRERDPVSRKREEGRRRRLQIRLQRRGVPRRFQNGPDENARYRV